MNGIDSLRKSYATLTPRERAAMAITEATTHQRDHVMQALVPQTAAESANEGRWTVAIICTCGQALTAALLAERRAQMLVTVLRSPPGSRLVAPRADLLQSLMVAMKERSAWLLALRQLEKETGMPLVAATDLLGGRDYAEQDVDGDIVDYSLQLDELRRIWKAFE